MLFLFATLFIIKCLVCSGFSIISAWGNETRKYILSFACLCGKRRERSKKTHPGIEYYVLEKKDERIFMSDDDSRRQRSQQ